MSIPENYVPILPLRDIVVFPHMIVPLFVGREKSIKALEAVMSEDKKVLLLAQKDGSTEDPSEEDLYKIGTIGNILQLLKLPDGTVKVLVEGISRASVHKFDSKDYLLASVYEKKDSISNNKDEKDILGMVRAVKSQFEQYSKLNKKITTEVLNTIDENDDPAKISDLICSNLDLKMSSKQELLELDNVISRLERILKFIEEEQGVLQAEKRIRNRVKRQMEKTQRDYYLNEQMKAIQKELGDSEDGKNELDEINDLIIDSKGKYLICVDDNGDISMFDAMSLEVPNNKERIVGKHDNIISSIKLFPRDAFVYASGGMDSILSIWSGSNLKLVNKIDVKAAATVDEEDSGNAGKVTSSTSNTTQMFNPPFVNDIEYSRNGKNIAVACGDSSIIVYNSKDGKYKKRFSGGHSSGVAQVVYTKSGRVISAGNDRMICCWGDTEGELKFQHPEPINKLLIRDSKDKKIGALLYVADSGNDITIYGSKGFI